MDNLGLGKVITKGQKRDATHIAVCPVWAGEGETLKPGDHIRLVAGSDRIVVKCGPEESIGIVDPFLLEVPEYACFWMWLKPGTITSLRHDWSHPAFPQEDYLSRSELQFSKEESEAWLREFCKYVDCPGFDIVIAAATNKKLESVDPEYYPEAYTNDGEYLYFGGRDAHGNIPQEFWWHVENYTGVEIPYEKKATEFTCSC